MNETQERWKKRQEQNFPRGQQQIEAYYKWLDERGYIDRGAYADGNKDGKIVFTEEGQKYLDRVSERDKLAKLMIHHGFLDGAEYHQGNIVFTEVGKKYLNKTELRKGKQVLTKQGQMRLRKLEAWEIRSTLNGVMDDIGEQVLASALFIAAGREDDIKHLF